MIALLERARPQREGSAGRGLARRAPGPALARAGACVALGLALAGGAGAQEGAAPSPTRGWLREIRLGVLAHDVGGLWSGSRAEDGVDVSGEAIFWAAGLALPWGTLHPNLGATLNTRGDTSKLYAGVLWELEGPWGLFLDLGLGGAVHDGKLDSDRDDRKSLGSRVLFRVPIEAGIAIRSHHRLMVSFDHVSNAYLASPNEGMDTLGLRYGYRF